MSQEHFIPELLLKLAKSLGLKTVTLNIDPTGLKPILVSNDSLLMPCRKNKKA